mgnify:FL=1
MDSLKISSVAVAMLIMMMGSATAQDSEESPNELLSFLEGKWHNYTTTISNGRQVNKAEYKETMHIKNDSTLTITAHKYKDGQDLTRDMSFIFDRDSVVMQQDDFKALGIRKGNVYYLKGISGDKTYLFRLYTMRDKYVFHSETWSGDKITSINMSYLLRE